MLEEMDVIRLRLSSELVKRVFQATAVKWETLRNCILSKRGVQNASEGTREKIKQDLDIVTHLRLDREI
jgi:hypothetical protein